MMKTDPFKYFHSSPVVIRLSEGSAPQKVVVATTPTFRQAMHRYLDLRSAEWSNAKHSKQWASTLNGTVRVNWLETGRAAAYV